MENFQEFTNSLNRAYFTQRQGTNWIQNWMNKFVKCEWCNEWVEKKDYKPEHHMCVECLEDRKLRHL